MPYCDQCGNEIKENALFCDQCGHEVGTKKTIKEDAKIDKNLNSKETKSNNGNNFEFSNINFATVVKFSIVGIIIAFILGILFINLIWSIDFLSYYSGAKTGLTRMSFIVGVILAVGLLAAHMKNMSESIIMGLIVGLLTGLFESTVISMFLNHFVIWWGMYVGNQVIILLIAGVVTAFISNKYLKNKVHLNIINQYLGE